jgi:hypothetical protein
VSARLIPSTRLSVITLADYQSFAVIQSRVHELWTRYFGASRGATANYSPSDCFENYAFPENLDVASVLGTVGEAYHSSRAQLMIARNEGMTKSYNRFHDVNEHSPDIGRLRDLHAEMDRAVLRAYGWGDLAERADPRFLNAETEGDHIYQDRLFWPSDFREEVLARLLKLNAERHEEEVRLGLAKHKTAVSEADEEADLGLDEVD